MKNLKLSKKANQFKIIWVTLFAAFITLNPSNSMSENNLKTEKEIVSNKQEKNPFRFENYKNIKEAEEALNKMYPSGSDADKMIEDMRKAEYIYYGVGDSYFNGRYKITDKNIVVFIQIKKGFMYEWHYSITIMMTDDHKIKSITVGREYFGV